LSGLDKIAQAMFDTETRKKIGRFLIAIAAADNIFHKNEISALKKVYKTIGLNPEDAVAEIELLRQKDSSLSTEPVIVKKGKDKTSGFAIPCSENIENEIRLDRAAIHKILEETRDIKETLSKVFNDEDFIKSIEIPKEKAKESPEEKLLNNKKIADTLHAPLLSDLHIKYHDFFKDLIMKEEWPAEEIKSLAQSHNLMLNGSLESINEWSDEKFGDILIEGDGPFVINRQILNGE